MAEYDNVENELDAMINGSYEVEEEETTNNEDTDHTEESEDVTETNEETAELPEDTDESEETEDEENTLVDEGSSEESDVDEDGTDSEEDENPDDSTGSDEEDTSKDEDNTETEDEADGADSENTDVIDYKKQYEELLETGKANQDFHDAVAGVKFKANGKEFEGFKDPKKIIQAQQMAYNYSEKMAGFKKYRPYMGPLKDRGMLEDSGKFDLAMSLIDGDKEALKQHIKNLNIDPIELDMDDIKYVAEPKSTSRDVIAIEDALEVAKSYGVEDRVYNTVMKDWDDESYREFVTNPSVQKDLAQQMEDGTYDIVMAKVKQNSILDGDSGLAMVNQYRKAVDELVREQKTKNARATEMEATRVADEAKVAKADKARKESEVKAAAKKESAYKAKVAKKNKAADEARKKATTVSKKKPNTSNKRAVDPMDYSGVEISNFLDKMIMGK